jgi:hypothetical protein
MTHPAIQHHLDAAAALNDAAEKHTAAAEAHESNDHDYAKEHAKAARQAVLEAGVKSESAVTASTAPPAMRSAPKDAPK